MHNNEILIHSHHKIRIICENKNVHQINKITSTFYKYILCMNIFSHGKLFHFLLKIYSSVEFTAVCKYLKTYTYKRTGIILLKHWVIDI